MAQPASEDLDKGLQDSGFKKDPNDPYYWRSNGRGGIEKAYPDGDFVQKPDSNDWHKHQNGDEY